jgi:hypothetical protein
MIIDTFKVTYQPLSFLKMDDSFSTSKGEKGMQEIITATQDNKIVDDHNAINEKNSKHIRNLVLEKCLYAFLSSRLKDILSRRIHIVLYFFITLIAFVFAWLLLTIMNHTLYRIAPTEFTLQIIPQFHYFIFYTFHSMLHGSIQEIIPAGVLAHIINIIAPITSLLFPGILLTIYIAVKSEQNQQIFKKNIAYCEIKVARLNTELLDNYKLTMEEAFNFLESKEKFVYPILKELNKVT